MAGRYAQRQGLRKGLVTREVRLVRRWEAARDFADARSRFTSSGPSFVRKTPARETAHLWVCNSNEAPVYVPEPILLRAVTGFQCPIGANERDHDASDVKQTTNGAAWGPL